MHTLDDFSRYMYLPSSSGCSLFVIDESRNLLVAAFKKKLLVYALGETVSPSQSLVKEIALSGRAISLLTQQTRSRAWSC